MTGILLQIDSLWILKEAKAMDMIQNSFPYFQ